MNSIANTEQTEIAVINSLATQAQILSTSIRMNYWQLAEVFVKAKELVPHGEWGKWLEDNTGVSKRTADEMMAAYKRFGGIPQLQNVSKAKLFKMLPLPVDMEEQFLQENNIDEMSTREITEAVKRAKAEAQAEIDRERRARMDAEQRAIELERREPEIPQEIKDELKQNREDLKLARDNADHFSGLAKKAINERSEFERKNRELLAEIEERDRDLEEQQQALDAVQNELLNLQSAAARGDAERTPADELTLSVFSAAVREFIGTCARMPYMQSAFSTMAQNDRSRYEELLNTVEGWCENARHALNTVAEGGVLLG